MQITDNVFLVTGGASGLGQATVRMLGAAGARVVIGDINEEAGARVAADIGPAAHFARVDVADEPSV